MFSPFKEFSEYFVVFVLEDFSGYFLVSVIKVFTQNFVIFLFKQFTENVWFNNFTRCFEISLVLKMSSFKELYFPPWDVFSILLSVFNILMDVLLFQKINFHLLISVISSYKNDLMALAHCSVWEKRKSCVWKFILKISYAQKAIENAELGVYTLYWYSIEPIEGSFKKKKLITS